MLSDHEQRALEEIERCFAAEAREPASSRPPRRRLGRPRSGPPGIRTVSVLGCLGVGLLVTGAATAALAIMLATAIGWLFWRLWSHVETGPPIAPAAIEADRVTAGPRHRPGDSIRQYLTWLSRTE